MMVMDSLVLRIIEMYIY